MGCGMGCGRSHMIRASSHMSHMHNCSPSAGDCVPLSAAAAPAVWCMGTRGYSAPARPGKLLSCLWAAASEAGSCPEASPPSSALQLPKEPDCRCQTAERCPPCRQTGRLRCATQHAGRQRSRAGGSLMSQPACAACCEGTPSGCASKHAGTSLRQHSLLQLCTAD